MPPCMRIVRPTLPEIAPSTVLLSCHYSPEGANLGAGEVDGLGPSGAREMVDVGSLTVSFGRDGSTQVWRFDAPRVAMR